MLNWFNNTDTDIDSTTPERAAEVRDANFARGKVQARVDDYMNNRGPVAVIKVMEILTDASGIEDYLVRLDHTLIPDLYDGKIVVSNGDLRRIPFSAHAMRQLLDTLGVRAAKETRDYGIGHDWEKRIALGIMKGHLHNAPKPKPVMLRCSGGDQKRVKAVVSNQYARYDSVEILTQFMKASEGNGASIVRADITDSRWYLEMLRPQVVDIETPNNGTVPAAFGASLGNSDYGAGSLELRIFILNLVCMNGMVGQTMIKKVHLGEQITNGEEMLSMETIKKRTAYFTGAMQDILGQAFSEVVVRRAVQNIQAGSAKIIDPSEQLGKMTAAQSIGKAEAEAILARMIGGSEKDGLAGLNSMWKFANALTAVARDMRITKGFAYTSTDGKARQMAGNVTRAREIEAIAGGLILAN